MNAALWASVLGLASGDSSRTALDQTEETVRGTDSKPQVQPTAVVETDWLAVEARVLSLAASARTQCVAIVSANCGRSSGALIGDGRRILTVAHGSSGPGERVTVISANGRRLPARVARWDRELDVAVLLLNEPLPARLGLNVRSASRSIERSGDGDAATDFPGDGVDVYLAVGHTGGHDSSRSAPVRMGFGFFRERSDLLVTTCRLAAGDSGGPLFNLRGELVAVHRTVETDGDFATHVPLSRFLSRWPDLAEDLQPTGAAAHEERY